MGLPNLYETTVALQQLVIAGVAHAADQPAMIPPVPMPAAQPDMTGLYEILTNLGGWGILLWALVNSVIKRAEGFGTNIVSRLDALSLQVKRLGREMRRIRHRPPLAAYSDDELPAPKPPRDDPT